MDIGKNAFSIILHLSTGNDASNIRLENTDEWGGKSIHSNESPHLNQTFFELNNFKMFGLRSRIPSCPK